MKVIKSAASLILSVVLSSYLLLFALVANIPQAAKSTDHLVFIDHQQAAVSIPKGERKLTCGYMKFVNPIGSLKKSVLPVQLLLPYIAHLSDFYSFLQPVKINNNAYNCEHFFNHIEGPALTILYAVFII